MSSYFPYHKDEWEQILTQAFDPDAPDPPFSEAYQKRKQEMENTMLRKKPEKKTHLYSGRSSRHWCPGHCCRSPGCCCRYGQEHL